MNAVASLRVDGVRLAAVGIPYSDLTWTDRADGGNFEASWSLNVTYGERPAPFFKGALTEVMLGAERRWCGYLDVLDWDAGTFTAAGLSRSAYDFLAISSGTTTSTTPNAIIDRAISLGWLVTRPNDMGSTPFVTGDATEAFNSVGTVVDQYIAALGQRWGIWGDGVIRRYSAPTVYDYLLAPGAIELGETTEDTFNVLVLSYINSATTLREAVGVGPGGTRRVEHQEDATNLGPISTATARAIANNLVALGNSSPGWTNGAEVSSAQLLTPGGLPAELATVTAGQMVRARIVGNYGQGYRDLVLGETKYAAGSDLISLSPVNKVASSFADVIEDTYTRLTGTPVAA